MTNELLCPDALNLVNNLLHTPSRVCFLFFYARFIFCFA